MVDFYDLSDLDRLFPGSGTYNPGLAEFTFSSADVSFQMTSNPAPYPVEVGGVGTVLNDTRMDKFTPVQSATGVIGMANVHSFSSVQPFDSQEIVRNWAMGSEKPVPLLSVANVGVQETLGTSIPTLFAGYSSSFNVSQSLISYENSPKANLTFEASSPSQISIPASPTFNGLITYVTPDEGSLNFSDPTAWSAHATSIPGISALASEKYYSTTEGNYTGIVSVTASNTSSRLPKSTSAAIASVPLDIAGFQEATLHLTYRAVDTISKPNNRTSLYFAIETPGEQGPGAGTYFFPAPHLSSDAFRGELVDNLTADGQWHQLSSNIGSYISPHMSTISLVFNATATNSENGTLQLQVTGAYVTVTGSASLVVDATLSQKGTAGSVAIALANPEVSILGNATMQVPFWVKGSLQTTNGSSFTATLPSLTTGLYKTTGKPVLFTAGKTQTYSFAVLGPNSSLNSAVLNRVGVSPIPTNGGYVIAGANSGNATLVLDYATVPYRVAVDDAGTNQISVSFSISDELGTPLLNATVPVGGKTFYLIPGTYSMSAGFEGLSVMSSTVIITAANGTTIHASVFKEGFQVEDTLGRPVPYATVTLKLVNSSLYPEGVVDVGTTDSSGRVYFEMVQNGLLQGSSYTVTVSSGGSTLTTQPVSASVNGALITIQTGYTPPSIIEYVIFAIIGIVLVVALGPRLLRNRTSLIPKFLRRPGSSSSAGRGRSRSILLDS